MDRLNHLASRAKVAWRRATRYRVQGRYAAADTEFRRAPVGRVHIAACRNVSCSLRGAERIVDHLARRLGISPGETTKDGRFSLATVECLASCGTAPVVTVNGTYHEDMTPERIDTLLAALNK